MSEKTQDLNAMAAKAQEAADLKAAMAAKEAAGKPQAAKAKAEADEQEAKAKELAKQDEDKLALASDKSKDYGIENRKVQAVFGDLIDPGHNHKYTTQPQPILEKNGWLAYQLYRGKMKYAD